jgi:hypothetical protein
MTTFSRKVICTLKFIKINNTKAHKSADVELAMVNLDFATVKLKLASRVTNMDGLGSFSVSLVTTFH